LQQGTWLDVVVLVLLLCFVIRGILRGTVAQVFAFFGLVLGIWAGAQLSHWIGDHWRDARPVFVFMLLRWIVAGLGGLAVATLFGWWGELVAKAVHEGPLGWLDRTLGGVLGAGFGAAVSAIVILLALQAPGLGFARPVARRSVTSRPLVTAGALATAWRGVPVPGAAWLHGQFILAEHHLSSSRSA
jgi:uncharacterized membrane protein required for colicin V production